jgi:hypothetical protein
MIIKVDGGSKLTGQFSSPMYGNQELTGFVSGQEFEFSIDGEAGAIPFKCVIEDANSIKGSFDNPGVGNSGTFVGKRKT